MKEEKTGREEKKRMRNAEEERWIKKIVSMRGGGGKMKATEEKT